MQNLVTDFRTPLSLSESELKRRLTELIDEINKHFATIEQRLIELEKHE